MRMITARPTRKQQGCNSTGEQFKFFSPTVRETPPYCPSRLRPKSDFAHRIEDITALRKGNVSCRQL